MRCWREDEGESVELFEKWSLAATSQLSTVQNFRLSAKQQEVDLHTFLCFIGGDPTACAWATVRGRRTGIIRNIYIYFFPPLMGFMLIHLLICYEILVPMTGFYLPGKWSGIVCFLVLIVSELVLRGLNFSFTSVFTRSFHVFVTAVTTHQASSFSLCVSSGANF